MKKFLILAVAFTTFFVGILIYNNVFAKNEIKANYSTYVMVKKNSNIYNSNFKKIGKVLNDISIELDGINDKYFKIKNTSYYVSYKDCIKSSKNEIVNTYEYERFNKNVKTKNVTYFYKDNEKILTLNESIDLPIVYMDDLFYYVNFFNNDLAIKKDETILVDNQKTNEYEAFAINYGNLDLNIMNETIEYLKENNYDFLNIDKYLKYLKGNFKLKNKSVLLLSESGYEEIVHKNDSNIKSYDASTIENLSDFEKIVNSVKLVNYNDELADKIPVLNYHFFYNDETKDDCNQSICLSEEKFKSHLHFLKENNYKTLSMAEFNDWMDGKVNLPKKSVLITIDDGGMGVDTIAQNLLKEYDMNATLFLITSWWTKDLYTFEKLEIHSHTHDMHTNGVCPGGQGGGIRCLDKQTILNDLKASRDYLNNPIAIAYPFYEYNDYAIDCVKESGFSLAFIGGYKKADRSNYKYLIPRYPIQNDISLDEFIRYVS